MIRCICGYEAADDQDLDDHIVAMMHDDEDHAPGRRSTKRKR